jgi:hypothetical protein
VLISIKLPISRQAGTVDPASAGGKNTVHFWGQGSGEMTMSMGGLP